MQCFMFMMIDEDHYDVSTNQRSAPLYFIAVQKEGMIKHVNTERKVVNFDKTSF